MIDDASQDVLASCRRMVGDHDKLFPFQVEPVDRYKQVQVSLTGTTFRGGGLTGRGFGMDGRDVEMEAGREEGEAGWLLAEGYWDGCVYWSGGVTGGVVGVEV